MQPGGRPCGGRGWLKIAALSALFLLGLTQRSNGQDAQPRPEHEFNLPGRTPESWVEDAVKYELEIIQHDSLPVRYRMRKVNERGDTTRIVMESREGNVARMIERDGRPLTAAEDAAERDRLNAILQSPDEYLKRERKDDPARDYAVQLVKMMPRAMLYTYASEQPQPENSTSRQIVIDFKPNPAFRPPTILSETLTGLEGRVWLDEQTGRMTRIQAHVLRPVYIGWGIIGKIYPGGTVEFEQICLDGKRWVYSHLEENLTLREMMVKTVVDTTKISSWDFEFLPAPISFQDAVRDLLAMPVKVQ
jgi:hypothetical protein